MKVSIICLTYNHQAYIRDALEGFVNQRTNFTFEAIVHDDASTDGTADIIKEYAERHPHIIKPILQKENQWSKGIPISKTFIYPIVKGEYVAYCEGDDYWTDPLKLQKQIDFLDAHPDYAICFHPAVVHWVDGSAPDSIYPGARARKPCLTFQDLVKRNFMPTTSVVYRWIFHDWDYDLLPNGILPSDWFLHLLHATQGKIACINEVMGVYRRHQGGIWFESGISKRWFLRYWKANLAFFDAMEKQFSVDRSDEKLVLLSQCYAFAIRDNDEQWLSELRKALPQEKVRIKFSKFEHIFWRFLEKILWGRARDKANAKKRIAKRCREILK